MALDAPFGNFKDDDGLKKSTALAKALGCDGKWVIHPDQIDTVNQVFTPAAEEIQRARRILDAADDRSRGAVAVEGSNGGPGHHSHCAQSLGSGSFSWKGLNPDLLYTTETPNPCPEGHTKQKQLNNL